jgi:PAS domain S-box-containing protein
VGRKLTGKAHENREEILQKIFDHIPVLVNFIDPQGRIVLVNREWERTLGWSAEEILSGKIDIYKECYPDPDERRSVVDFIAAAGTGGGEWAEFRPRARDGRIIETEWYEVRLSDGTTIGFGKDITRQKRGERALRASAERAGWLASFPELTPAMVIEIDMAGQVYYANPAVRQRFPDLMPGPEAPQAPLHPLLAGLIGTAAWNMEPASEPFVREIEIDGRWYQQVMYRVEPLGRLRIYGQDITGRKRAEADLRRSLDQSRALAARIETVRENERSLVAREIHDEFGQAFTAIKLEAASWAAELPNGCGAARAEAIMRLTDQGIQAARRISTELRPQVLDDLGLVAAVEWATGEFSDRAGFRCDVDLPAADLNLDPDVSTAIFRILQEALTNVARHANATEVEVWLAAEDGRVCLQVRDNGRGITDGQVSGGASLGILGMKERALLLGGVFDIRRLPGGGTEVTARIPGARPSEARD